MGRTTAARPRVLVPGPRQIGHAAVDARKPHVAVTQPQPSADWQHSFILEYVANGGNATAAYAAVRPTCRRSTCATEGYKLLRKPEIAKAIKKAREEHWHRLKMEGTEALALISIRARADVGLMFDSRGNRLPICDWPVALRLCVKSIKAGPHGDTITFYDGLRAAELMARAAGKLGSEAAPGFDHLGYLAALQRRHEASQQ
ncbi:terminase small subunit [Luteitalea sp.]|uniref:terminase small subunit n=1 Tax=Luteitalea sp. TaxID=2004800 RepID=UPI0025C17A1C|nr:terminase small subunit [Luteitalea sp.]